MVQVPIQRVPQVMPGRAPDAYQRIDASPLAIGGRALGSSLQNLGGAMSDFAVKFLAEREKLDNEAAVADSSHAFLEAQKDQAPLDAAYYTLQGKDAVNATQGYYDSLEAIRQKHLANLGSDKAKKLFDNEFTRSMATDIGAAAKHAAVEQKSYEDQQSTARINQAIFDSAKHFGDEKAFQGDLSAIGREIDFKGKSQGWSDEQINDTKTKAVGQAWAARVRELAIYNPYQAKAMYDANSDKFDFDQRTILQTAIKTSQESIGVKAGADMIMGNGPMARPEIVKSMRVMPIAPSVNISYVDPRLVDTVELASGYLPDGYKIRINSGYSETHGDSGSQHRKAGKGALDITIIRPDGTEIPNRGEDYTHMYERLARGAYSIIEQKYPELRGIFAWGGAFGVTTGSNVRDLMHFDLGGPRGQLGYPQALGPYIDRGGGRAEGAPEIRPDNLVRRVMQQESGGRPGLISPAGAVGPMQILPSTGREIARRLGVPFDETALRYDYKYNVMLGTAYLNSLLAKYGNEALAVAAYNAGEGRVDQWIKQYGDPRGGSISTAEWIAKIPIAETRNYVTNIESAAAPLANIQTDFSRGPIVGGAAAGGDNTRTWDQVEAAGIAYADLHFPDDPVAKDNLLTELHSRYTRDKTTQSEVEDKAFNMLTQDAIERKVTSLTQLLDTRDKQDAWNTVGGDKKISINTIINGNNGKDIAETPENQNRYYEIRGKMAQDQDFALKFNPWDPKEDLTKAQRDSIDVEQKKLIAAGAKPGAQTKLDVSATMNDAEVQLAAAGLAKPRANVDPAEAAPINRARAIFQGQLISKEQAAIDAKGGKPLSGDEKQKIIEDLLQKFPFASVSRGAGEIFSFSSEKFPEQPVYAFELKDVPTFAKTFNLSQAAAEITLLAQVPDDIEQSIRESAMRQTGRPPTPIDIINTYMKLTRNAEFRSKHGLEDPDLKTPVGDQYIPRATWDAYQPAPPAQQVPTTLPKPPPPKSGVPTGQ